MRRTPRLVTVVAALIVLLATMTSAASARRTQAAVVPGPFTDLAVGRNQDGRLEVFAVDYTQRLIWHKWQLSTAGGGTWSGWAELGGSAVVFVETVDSLAVARHRDGRLEVFAKSLNGYIQHIWQNCPGCGWGEWQRLGGNLVYLAGGPVVATHVDGRLEVFARAENLETHHLEENCAGCDWEPRWRSLSSTMYTRLDPAVFTGYQGSLAIFTVGIGGRPVNHMWQSVVNPDVWQGPISLDGSDMSELAATSYTDGRGEIFVIGLGETVYNKPQNCTGCGWGAWQSRGTPPSHRDLQVLRTNSNTVALFTLGWDGNVYHTWQRSPGGNWYPGWFNLGGGALTADLAVGWTADNRAHLFSVDTNGRLRQNFQKCSGCGWNGWVTQF